MNPNGHYDVKYWADGARAGQVNALVCRHCDFFVKVAPLSSRETRAARAETDPR